jgi:hypothetical protein
MPISGDPKTQRKIDKFLRNGRKIQAVKVYREATGLGLKEAKDHIDAYHNELIRLQPWDYGAQPEPTGPKSFSGKAVIAAISGLAILVAIYVIMKLLRI